MWKEWIWRKFRAPEDASYGVRLDGWLHVGCVRAPARTPSVLSSLETAGRLLWIDTTGTIPIRQICGYGLRVDEAEVPALLRLLEANAAFDVLLLTIATTTARDDPAELAGYLADCAARERMRLVVVGVGALGWGDPTLRTLAAQATRLPHPETWER